MTGEAGPRRSRGSEGGARGEPGDGFIEYADARARYFARLKQDSEVRALEDALALHATAKDPRPDSPGWRSTE